MALEAVKQLLPDRPVPLRILRGPFRGARLVMNPRHSCRKILGLYERELNQWLQAVLLRVSRAVDVGANDGYFTFGCAAAFRRLGKRGEIVAFEPEERHFRALQRSVDEQPDATVRFTLIQSTVGAGVKSEMATLDTVRWTMGDPADRTNTLIKIDVEGAEEAVLAGASSWLNASNLFLIEVHRRAYLQSISQLFAAQGLKLERVDQRPLRVIGFEKRDEENWWLVSRVGIVSHEK
jgi:hypothetical protein